MSRECTEPRKARGGSRGGRGGGGGGGWNTGVPGAKIFVGGLGFRTEEDQVKEFFSQAGTVTNVRIAQDRETGKARGFCHVEFETAEMA